MTFVLVPSVYCWVAHCWKCKEWCCTLSAGHVSHICVGKRLALRRKFSSTLSPSALNNSTTPTFRTSLAKRLNGVNITNEHSPSIIFNWHEPELAQRQVRGRWWQRAMGDGRGGGAFEIGRTGCVCVSVWLAWYEGEVERSVCEGS